MMKRLLAMGDIHGMFDRFLEVWDAVQFRPDEDEIVFLGDYTDRGHQNAAMMKWVMAHEGEPGMVFLRGNHEAMCADGAGHAATLLEGDFMSDYHPDRALAYQLWLNNGGYETFSEIEASDAPLALHRAWQAAIRKMPLCCTKEWQGQRYFFTHGSIDPDCPLNEQEKDTLLWSRTLAEEPERYHGEAIIILGHTPVQLLGKPPVPQVLADGHVILMDTGSFLSEGRISCMDLLTHEVWQSRDSEL